MTTEKAAPKKISPESAKAQIEAWLDYFGLDFGDIELEDGEDAAKTLMNTLVRAIRRGELDINVDDELSVTQHLKFKTDQTESITYTDKISRARIAMDKSPAKHAQGRMYSFMAAMSGVPVSELLKLKGADATIFNRVATVFSMV